VAAKLAHVTCILELLLCKVFVGWSPWCTQPPSWLPLLSKYSLMPFWLHYFMYLFSTCWAFLATVCCSLSCAYSQLVEPFWLQFVAVFHEHILKLSKPVWLQSFIVVTCLCSHMAHHDVVVVCHVSWSSPVWLHIFWSLHLEPQFWKKLSWCDVTILCCNVILHHKWSA